MGLASTILFWSIIVSGFFQLVAPAAWKTPYTSVVESLTGKTISYDSQGNPIFMDAQNSGCIDVPLAGQRCFGSLNLVALFLGVLGLAALASLASIIPGLGGFPNPYTLFAVITIFLVGFFTFPISLLVDSTAPAAMRVIFVPLMAGSYAFALFAWYKGGDMP